MLDNIEHEYNFNLVHLSNAVIWLAELSHTISHKLNVFLTRGGQQNSELLASPNFGARFRNVSELNNDSIPMETERIKFSPFRKFKS